jgi:hypothetical protein
LISAQSHGTISLDLGTISLDASLLGTISAQLAGDTRPFKTVSSAEFVHDVNTDPICIVNGLTKNWRLPGWRICWVVGPRHCIDVLGSVGSYMDGGANHPLQKAALPFLHPDFVIADALALQAHFRKKRDFLIEQLTALGISVRKPEATFYIWADTSKLPAPINNGVIFFEYCIRFKVICVPVSGLGRSSCEFTWRAAVPSTARSTAPARSAHNVPCTCVSLTLASGHLLRHQPLPPPTIPPEPVCGSSAHVVRSSVAEPHQSGGQHQGDDRVGKHGQAAPVDQTDARRRNVRLNLYPRGVSALFSGLHTTIVEF